MSQQNRKQPQLTLPLGYTRDGKPFVLTDEYLKHIWLQGTSGSGKSWAVCWIILCLLKQVNCIVLDPHGDLCENLLRYLAYSGFWKNEKAFDKLWYIEMRLAKNKAALAWNVLNQPYTPFETAQHFMNAVHRAFPTTGATTALDNLLLAGCLLLTLNHEPVTSLYDVVFNSTYREMLLKNCNQKQYEQIQSFFAYKFPGDKVNSQTVDSTLRRLFLLTFSPVLKNMLSQKENRLSFPTIIQQQKSLIINLGGLTEDETKLTSCLITKQIEEAFLARADIPEMERSRYFVLIDEFATFVEQSGEAFNNIMEQLRKYKCSLLLINQHLEQLPRSIVGALGNATPIMMRSSYHDSHTLASYFYRKQEIVEQDFLSSFLFPQEQEQDAFSGIENVSQARSLYEGLERQEALVTLRGQTHYVKIPTLPPVRLPSGLIERIKQAYEQKLLTPLSALYAPGASQSVVSSAPSAIAKRRVPVTSPHSHTPLQTFVGASGTDAELQSIFSLYGGYLTVSMVAKILGKSENTARNKLNKLVAAGILETQNLPRTSPSGKTPTVFSLKKGTRKHEFLDHRLATAALLVNTALLPTFARSDFTIVDIQSDDNLKASPLKLPHGNIIVPDGSARLRTKDYEYAIYYETDRSTESREIITNKLTAYKTLASQCACMVVAFCVVEGGDLRGKTLKNWAADVLPDAYRALFFFAHIDLDTLTPDTLFLKPIWSSVGNTTLQSLIEI